MKTGVISLPVVIITTVFLLLLLRCCILVCVRCCRRRRSRSAKFDTAPEQEESDTASLLSAGSGERGLVWGTHSVVKNEYAHYFERPSPPLRSISCLDYLLCRCCTDDGFDGRVKTYPTGMPHRLLLGITLDGLREWASTAAHASTASTEPIENGYMAQQLADHLSAADGLSVCERMSQTWYTSKFIGRADVYVCWALSSQMSALLEALETFLELPYRDERVGGPMRVRDRAQTFFWISTCAS